ncbi:hypothetical protein, partial [Arthrobacter sp. RIT-PI-e]|uniref:hypothetical protein n=1 Tax=Arthrobacter sp. RIT-PI-e TaxID=1681197 RepID=UPI0006762B74
NAIHDQGHEAMMLKTAGGRKTTTGWWEALGWAPSTRWQDRIETIVRGFNAVLNEVRVRGFEGVIILDRGLVCQLALRRARGLPSGFVLRWLQHLLPAPEVIVYFDLSVDEALARVNARGTDVETLAGLSALNAGYRELPEYAGFTLIDADRPTADIVLDLLALTYQGGRQPHQEALISC